MTVNLADLNEAAGALYNVGEKRLCAAVRAAAAEIERLREAAEDVYSPWSCGEPLDREMRELGRAIGMTLDPA